MIRDEAVKCVDMDKADLHRCQLVNKLADPELTGVYAGSQDKKRPAICVLRNVRRLEIVMSFVPHTIDAVQTFLLRSPNSGSPRCLQKGMFRGSAVAALNLCVEVQVAQCGRLPVVFFSNIDAVNLKKCSWTTPQLDAIILLLALGSEE